MILLMLFAHAAVGVVIVIDQDISRVCTMLKPSKSGHYGVPQEFRVGGSAGRNTIRGERGIGSVRVEWVECKPTFKAIESSISRSRESQSIELANIHQNSLEAVHGGTFWENGEGKFYI